MRTVPCPSLLALAFALSGCLSSFSPEGTVWSEDATALRVEYGGGGDEVSGALVQRGCSPDAPGLYRCDVRGADGRAYVAEVAVADRLRPQRALGPDAGEATDEYVVERDHSESVLTTADGERANLGDEPVGDHRLADPESRGPAAPVRVRATARLFAGGEPGRPVRLAGDAAAPLRETLRALLVSGLPALNASYGE